MTSVLDGDRSSVRIAARNSAEGCDILCRTHGVPGRFDPDAWVNLQSTPPYYSGRRVERLSRLPRHAHPGSAVVGYQTGEELAAGHRQSVESAGALRI